MKLVRTVFIVAGICALFAANAAADGLVQFTSSDIHYVAEEDTDPSPSDIVPAPDLLADGKEFDGKEEGCGSGKATKGYCDPWELFPETCGGLKIGGWLQMGYHTAGANGDGTGMFNDYPNVVQLQQAWAYVERATDNGGYGWDWGFRLDYVYGTDAQDTQAFGGQPNAWDNPWDNGFYYGHAIPQLYAEVAYNDLKVKVGHFYTICGYEVVQAPDNFFYSHAFTMYLAEPFTHTGALAEYPVSDNVTVWGGWTAGWDTGFSSNGGDIFLGGASVTLRDWLTLTYTTTMGDFGWDFTVGPITFAGSDSNGYSHSIVVDMDITSRLKYVFQSDYIDNDLFHFGADPFGFHTSWGINQYLLYSISDRLGVGARVEYFDQGAYEVTAATLGLNVKPRANFILRPEVRFEDWSTGNLIGRQDSTVFGIDAIVTF